VARYDVIVVGGGNAALCAALSAREKAQKVLLLERATWHMRGGNTRHTRNIRCLSLSDPFSAGKYGEEEFLDDLIGVTGGPQNLDLAKFTIRESATLRQWMTDRGVAWQPPLAGTLHLGRTNRWFLGGGKALVNSYFRRAEQIGIDVRYDACVEDFVVDDRVCRGVAVKNPEGASEFIAARAVVVAAGGFEANIEWLKRYWGDAADNFIVRGTPYNDGMALANLLEKGANPIGNPKGFHAIAVDARAPKFDGGIVSRLDSVPFGVVVNRSGVRFYDEGENIWPKRYAIWGSLIAEQDGQTAYSILDSKTIDSFLPPLFEPYVAGSIEELATALTLDPATLGKTIREYNQSAAGNVDFKPGSLDGCATRGLAIPKSNWAMPIDRPPYYAFPLRPGITFTYMGVEVDPVARIVRQDGQPFQNLYAAGEIMSGNILTKGYLAGFGLTIGSVFGRLAGKEAATHARS
jgi:tricarballylate dehydrogenase